MYNRKECPHCGGEVIAQQGSEWFFDLETNFPNKEFGYIPKCTSCGL